MTVLCCLKRWLIYYTDSLHCPHHPLDQRWAHWCMVGTVACWQQRCESCYLVMCLYWVQSIHWTQWQDCSQSCPVMLSRSGWQQSPHTVEWWRGWWWRWAGEEELTEENMNYWTNNYILLLCTCRTSPCISMTVRDGIPWIRTTHSYVSAFEVTTGVNWSGMVYAVPSLVCIPGVPAGGANHAKVTLPTTSLSTTPSSLQVMLKSSPAIGIPGTVTAGLKRSRVSSIEYTCTWTHIIKHQISLHCMHRTEWVFIYSHTAKMTWLFWHKLVYPSCLTYTMLQLGTWL